MDRVQEKCSQPVPTAKIFTDLSSASDSLCDEDAADHLHEALLRDPGEMSLEERVGVEHKKRGDVEGKGPDMEQARQFATANGMSLVRLKQLGKNLGLSITQSKRASSSYRDRISYGFSKAVQKLVTQKTNSTPSRGLFKFTGTKEGLFFASTCAMTYLVS